MLGKIHAVDKELFFDLLSEVKGENMALKKSNQPKEDLGKERICLQNLMTTKN